MDEKIKNKKSQKIFIEPLEQRIMLDGAGASTFLDLIDERNQQEIKKNSKNKDIYKEDADYIIKNANKKAEEKAIRIAEMRHKRALSRGFSEYADAMKQMREKYPESEASGDPNE